ncbi:hypothetical protein Pla52o_55730 [Novipirellula galeiformis]|uniref:CBM-cenC domain-containing protein n=1 Tax=Novipirellula galeiformis TaxID=2528004 RepID=A0A5C6BV00_9BACT|nr:DUF4838 domain-containing protein [Novipirellula galeiformis]TWU15036.1 hypothetical protein Pla52o_55730 [Novipirellula galeiformis]
MVRKHLLRLGLSLASGLGVLWSCQQNADAMIVVQNGQPRATIVVAQDASEQVRRAAQTLQEYILKSSGAKLPIAATAVGNAITVGQNAAVDTSEIDSDGFILQGLNDHQYAIAGGSDWGTEFGVYDFLERYLGVRWLMPTDLGTDIPKHQTIDIPDTKIVQQPTYLSRQFSPINLTVNSPSGKWGRFNRARGRVEFHHNLLNLFPPSRFAKTHPEFYPVQQDGKRYIPKDDVDPHWQPNLTAPGIVDVAVERIEKYFEEHPNATSYSLGMNDSNNWDQSAVSRAKRNGKTNFLGYEDVSDEYFTWANAVVEKVLVKYPDKYFGVLAYNGIAEPPTKVDVNSHIVPFITYDRMRWEDPVLREQGRLLTQRWEKVSPVLGWYDYAYGISYQLPRVFFHRAQKYLSWGADHQVEYSYAELYPNWGSGPKPWVFSKLYWNPNQDVDALLDDWCAHFAGEKAGPKLKNFYSTWEKFWTVDLYHSKWNTDKGQYLPFNADPSYLMDVPQSYITQSDADFAAALQLADTPERKARVAKLKEMWDFYKASIITYQGEELASKSDPQSEKDALTLLDKAADVMVQASKRKTLLAAFAKDPLYSGSADYITRYPATNGGNWGPSLLWRVLPWVEKSASVKASMEKLAASTDPAVSEPAQLILHTVNGKSVLVSKNPSFEEGTAGWTTWDKSDESTTYHKGIWKATPDQAHSGKQSFMIKGLGRGAAIQDIAYEPGTYYAQVYCYVPEGSKPGTASVVLSVAGNSKMILPSTLITLKPGTWSNSVVPFTLTEDKTGKATAVRMLMLLDGFGPDGELYVDDAGIYKIDNK